MIAAVWFATPAPDLCTTWVCYGMGFAGGGAGCTLCTCQLVSVFTRFAVANRRDSSGGFGASTFFAGSEAAGFGAGPHELNNTMAIADAITVRMV